MIDDAGVERAGDRRGGRAAPSDLDAARFRRRVGHDLRTPLTAISGYAELLLEDAERRGLADAARDLRRILDAATHLEAAVNQHFERWPDHTVAGERVEG